MMMTMMMMSKRDKAFITIAISLAALALRIACFEYTSHDYSGFLLPWMNEFREGGFLALQTTSSNYNLPYLYFLALFSYIPIRDLYLIKILSVIFDYVIAFTMMDLVKRNSGKNQILPLFIFALTLFWPAIWLNSAYWAQCDAIYAAFCLLAYSAALKDKPICSVLFAGLAFAFKLQTVFFLPVFVVLWLDRRFRLWHALLFPIPYVILSIPVLFVGWTPMRVIGIYTDQMGVYSDWLTLNAPNLFSILKLGNISKHPWFEIGIILAGVFVIFMLVLAAAKRNVLDEKAHSAFALAICLGVVWLLPSMHDRYFYLADVFVILFVALNPKCWYVAPLVMFGSLAGYHAYLVLGRLSDDLWLAALILLAALICVVVTCIKIPRRRGKWVRVT
jgi:Gpi18-like mannosyltransferase